MIEPIEVAGERYEAEVPETLDLAERAELALNALVGCTDAVLGRREWYGVKQTTEYTCHFKGNTLVDITPRDERPGYPIYRRDQYLRDKAPLTRKHCYVSPVILS